MTIARLALLSVHTSPLAQLGGSKTGGMNVYVREIAQEFAQRGIAVDIFTRRVAAGTPIVDTSLGDNVRVVHILAGPEQTLAPDDVYPYLPQFTAGVQTFVTGESLVYDLIYSHYWLSGMAAHALKAVWDIPFVQMFHTLGQMKNRIVLRDSASLSPDVRVYHETRIVQWANHLIAATTAEQTQLLWLYRADRRKISIIPPGVNTLRFQPVPVVAAKHQLGLPLDEQLLLFVGRIEPLKGVDSILQALAVIHQRSPQLLAAARFIIVGGDTSTMDAGELARLRQLGSQLGLSHLIEFLGAKDQSLLPLYYSAALAVIMPSDYESFGLVALEAMACGTPVIASQVGGLAYLIRDGETGFLVPVRDPAILADRITTLLTDVEQRKQMGQAAAALARQYSWSAIADQLLSLFQRVVDQQRLSRHMN